ncbi:MAG: cytochrome c [Deltaproteobacteria bacterium]|nr:cytochrome c [Deltaproteobacteria bacterium]
MSVVAVLLLACASVGGTADPTADARRVVLAVQYVGTDYPLAVRDGTVINAFEYDEQTAFLRDAVALYAQRVPAGRHAAALEALRDAHARRVPAPELAARARALAPPLADELTLPAAPAAWPPLDRARAVFATVCANCHGATGMGDGPLGKPLVPPPATMAVPAWADERAPFQLYNTITLGIRGTGMMGYAPQLDEQTRWALAFLVLTLRTPAPDAPPAPALPLARLASRTNRQLAEDLVTQRRAPDLAAGLVLADAARRAPPPRPTPEQALHAVTTAAREAAALVAAGERPRADNLMDEVVAGSLREVAQDLRLRDAAGTDALLGAVRSLRGAITDGSNVDARVADVLARAEALAVANQPGGAGPGWGWLPTALGALLVLAGLVVLLRRPR